MNKKNPNNDPGAPLSPKDGRLIAEIEIGLAKHERFLYLNYKKVVLAILGVVVVVSGVIIYSVLQDEEKRDSGAALVHAMNLDPIGYGTREGMNIEGLEKVKRDYPSTHAAVSAQYLKVLALWEEGREDEGIAAMESFISSAANDEWKAQASTILGCRYMKAGKNDDAVRHFKTAANYNHSVYSPVALMSLGDIAREKGDNDEARSYYDEVFERFPQSIFAISSEEEDGGISGVGAAARKNLLGIKSPERVHLPEASKTSPLLDSNGGLDLPSSFELPGAGN